MKKVLLFCFVVFFGTTYAETDLYNGKPVPEGGLKFSVYIGNCTASVVGPDTILTAGHCRSSGSSASFVLNGKRYEGKCTRHPDYNRGGYYINNDFTLCKLSGEVSGIAFASLKPVTKKAGDKAILQGYGKGSNGSLKWGVMPIKTANDQDYITQGTTYLGGGDSGGGMIDYVEDLVNGPFYVIGVNSRGGGNTSYFNRTDLDRSQRWFKDWASKNSAKVCGLTMDCEEEQPEPSCEAEKLAFDEAKKALELCESGL